MASPPESELACRHRGTHRRPDVIRLRAAVIVRLAALLAAALCGVVVGNADAWQTSAPIYGYRVVASYPHDPSAFTQGLVFIDGALYEGTGNYGASVLRRVALTTGVVEQETRLGATLFGEGVTDWKDQLIQLTWREGIGLVHDRKTLQTLQTFPLGGEGWGITHDQHRLIMSDGSAWLHFLDPASRRPVGQVQVRDGESPLDRLNELEFIGGEVWANIWKSDVIARIAPDTGQVTGYIDLSGLWPAAERPDSEAVLNGIAFDAATGRLFVTGKYWPRLYEIQVEPPLANASTASHMK